MSELRDIAAALDVPDNQLALAMEKQKTKQAELALSKAKSFHRLLIVVVVILAMAGIFVTMLATHQEVKFIQSVMGSAFAMAILLFLFVF